MSSPHAVFEGLSLAVRSHDQFKASHCPPPPPPPKEVFPIGHMDRPCVMFRMIPACSLKIKEVFLDSWIVLALTLKNKEVLKRVFLKLL